MVQGLEVRVDNSTYHTWCVAFSTVMPYQLLKRELRLDRAGQKVGRRSGSAAARFNALSVSLRSHAIVSSAR
jgi:hypothetical protein